MRVGGVHARTRTRSEMHTHVRGCGERRSLNVCACAGFKAELVAYGFMPLAALVGVLLVGFVWSTLEHLARHSWRSSAYYYC